MKKLILTLTGVVVIPIATLILAVPANAQTDAILDPMGGRGGSLFLSRCTFGQYLTGLDLRIGDDVDAIRPLCVTAYSSVEVGPINPNQSSHGGTGGGGDIRVVCQPDAPVVVGILVEWEGLDTRTVNGMDLYCGTVTSTQQALQYPAARYRGPGGAGGKEFERQNCPAGLVAVGITGRSGIWLDALGLVCGAPRLATREAPPGPAPGTRSARTFTGSNDFNADGRGDILWYNASTGESQIWFLNGSSRTGRATVLDGGRPTLIGAPWSIVGSSDFNGDGKTDLLWHNSSTGETQIWHMAGHTFSSKATVLDENARALLVGLPWSIVGSSDMNGDRKSDIIWHNSATGATQIWEMNGHRVTGRATVLDENGSALLVGLPWSIVGANDFNGDRRPDIVWHNASTRATQIWEMNGHRVTGRATVLDENGSAIMVGLPWRITGTNDFDRDGSADLLWHNGSTGETQIWLMKGRSIIGRNTVDADRDGGGARVAAPWSIMRH